MPKLMRQPAERPVSSMTNSAVLRPLVLSAGSSSPPCQLMPCHPLSLWHVRTCIPLDTETPLVMRLLKLSCAQLHHGCYVLLYLYSYITRGWKYQNGLKYIWAYNLSCAFKSISKLKRSHSWTKMLTASAIELGSVRKVGLGGKSIRQPLISIASIISGIIFPAIPEFPTLVTDPTARPSHGHHPTAGRYHQGYW
jgi:hypothetical protein